MQDLGKSSDEELMRAYQLGDERAFELLYARHSGRLYGFLRKRFQDPTTVEDVFQSTFLKLHSARSHYDSSFPFLPWLFTVCRSVLSDNLRKKARILEDLNQESVDAAVAPWKDEVPDAGFPDLGELPVAQREALELRYRSDLPFEEIARRLETSPGNVRQLISRAIRRLKRET